MGLLDGLFSTLGDFAETAGGLAKDLQPVADLYGSLSGGGGLDLSGLKPSTGLGGGGLGLGGTPPLVPVGTSYPQGPPTVETTRNNTLILLAVAGLLLFAITRR